MNFKILAAVKGLYCIFAKKIFLHLFFIAPPTYTPPSCLNGRWTQFFDRDQPSGNGDYETLIDINRQYPGRACSNPTAVDARVVSNGNDYRTAGQVVRVSTSHGLTCENSRQRDRRRCLDYRVRFCCPSKFVVVARVTRKCCSA